MMWAGSYFYGKVRILLRQGWGGQGIRAMLFFANTENLFYFPATLRISPYISVYLRTPPYLSVSNIS